MAYLSPEVYIPLSKEPVRVLYPNPFSAHMLEPQELFPNQPAVIGSSISPEEYQHAAEVLKTAQGYQATYILLSVYQDEVKVPRAIVDIMPILLPSLSLEASSNPRHCRLSYSPATYELPLHPDSGISPNDRKYIMTDRENETTGLLNNSDYYNREDLSRLNYDGLKQYLELHVTAADIFPAPVRTFVRFLLSTYHNRPDCTPGRSAISMTYYGA